MPRLHLPTLAFALIVLSSGGAIAQSCSSFQTCAQAVASYKAGNTKLDRDKDGVPCESLCGKKRREHAVGADGRSRVSTGTKGGMLRASIAALSMSTHEFTPDYLSRAAEQLGWDESPAGQQKRQEDLALLQELMAVSKRAADHSPG